MAERLGLTAEQTVKFEALKRTRSEARAEVREILRENPELSSPEDVESILAERRGIEAVLALRQRSHLTEVHAVLGDDRFKAYRDLVQSGDWDTASTSPDSLPNSSAR